MWQGSYPQVHACTVDVSGQGGAIGSNQHAILIEAKVGLGRNSADMDIARANGVHPTWGDSVVTGRAETGEQLTKSC